jgi:uridine kinase
MELVSSPRVDLARDLCAEIMHNYGRGRVLVAVDAAAGAGGGDVADLLAAAFAEAGIASVRASLAAFHRPRAERYARGRDSAVGYYEDSYDLPTLRRVLIEPFRMAGSTGFQTRAFDVRRDAPVVSSWVTGPADLVLVIDGEFLLRPELRGAWHASIHLEVPDAVRYERLAAFERRDPDPAAASNARYVGAHELYRDDAQPLFAASAIVDNTDPEHPRRIFADTGCACG